MSRGMPKLCVGCKKHKRPLGHMLCATCRAEAATAVLKAVEPPDKK